jgi:hypothetical protein
MQFGGMMLGAGMIMVFEEGDYLYGQGPVRFTLQRVVETRHEWGCEWIVMTGQEKAPLGPWRERRIQVRTSALKKALTLTNASTVR